MLLEVGQFLVDGLTHTRHILSLLDLHREQDTLRTVVSDVFRHARIFTLYLGHILQSHVVSLAVSINQRVLHVVNLVQGVVNVDGRLVALVLHASCSSHETLFPQLHGNELVANAVVRQFIGVQVDRYLVTLFTEDRHLTHAGYQSQ